MVFSFRYFTDNSRPRGMLVSKLHAMNLRMSVVSSILCKFVVVTRLTEMYLLNVIVVNELNFYSMFKFVMELGS